MVGLHKCNILSNFALMRNPVFSVCKAIGIILMVIGHAEAPELVCNFLYTFHMPLFFIAAGYFFSEKNLADPWTFCKKRFKGLYLPFVKWSLVYLLLHNVFHYFGILNETYGNWTGGVMAYSRLQNYQSFKNPLLRPWSSPDRLPHGDSLQQYRFLLDSIFHRRCCSPPIHHIHLETDKNHSLPTRPETRLSCCFGHTFGECIHALAYLPG